MEFRNMGFSGWMALGKGNRDLEYWNLKLSFRQVTTNLIRN